MCLAFKEEFKKQNPTTTFLKRKEVTKENKIKQSKLRGTKNQLKVQKVKNYTK